METILYLLIGAGVGTFLSYLWGLRPVVHRLRLLREESQKLRDSESHFRAKNELLETSLPKQLEAVKLALGVQSQQAAQQQREALLKGNSQQIGDVLKPIKEELEKFRAQIERTNTRSSEYQGRLDAQLKAMFEKTQTLSADAKALTEALRGENKTQGQWGEYILVRLLEVSGLIKDAHYRVQKSFDRDSGKSLQPDVIIHLPDKKHLVIDAKVSLAAYMDYVSQEASAEARQKSLSNLRVSLMNHIRDLSGRGYERIEGLGTPDYVFMFIANEPAYLLAMNQRGWNLMEYGLERKVMIVSPSTLLAVLRTVASVWQLAKQQANAQEISRQGARLLDKFVGFQESLKEIGKSLGGAQKSYETACNRLYDGRDNLMQQAEKLKALGIGGKKTLKNGQSPSL